jgi:hypothetical protein
VERLDTRVGSLGTRRHTIGTMMFGFMQSNRARAVEATVDFIPKMLAPCGRLSAIALRDHYCVGFLEMVGAHVASQSLENPTRPIESQPISRACGARPQGVRPADL